MTRFTLSFVLALLAGAPLLAAGVAPEAAPTVRVRTVRATAPSGGSWVPATVAAVEHATLSTRVAATAKAVLVQEGQRVARGQVVATLTAADLRGAAAAAESALLAATAQERRIQALLKERAATPAELEMASAQRAQAEAAVAAAQTNLAYTEIRAPFAGTVQARRVEPGDLVGPGQPLVVLEGNALELVASLSEAEATGLALGAALRFEAEGAPGTATVTALNPGGDPLSHRRGLRARIRTAGPSVRSGAFARLEVAAAQANIPGVWVPRSALIERGDLTGVFVAAAGRAELHWIAVGESAGEGVMVRAGIRPADAVVDAPGALRDGQLVEVMP
jgi:RND family efflux transporter MFP subunit